MSHIFLKNRNAGMNLKMRGNLGFCYILVDTPNNKWTKSLEAEAIDKIKKTSEFLMKSAKAKHVPLQIRDFILRGYSPVEIEYNASAFAHCRQVLASMGYPNVKQLWGSMMGKAKLDDAVICFVLPYFGVSFANQSSYPMSEEFTVIMGKVTYGAYIHEICHVYGAVDYYYNEFVKEKVRRYFGGSVMDDATQIYIDDLTSYLIGWEDTLSENARIFLQETSHITEESWFNDLKKVLSK